jgi:hypothetical protein
MKVLEKMAFVLVGGTVAAILIAGAMSLLASRSANATTQFAAQTGKPCAQCHQNPTGGPALTPFGEQFKANGDELPKDPPAK